MHLRRLYSRARALISMNTLREWRRRSQYKISGSFEDGYKLPPYPHSAYTLTLAQLHNLILHTCPVIRKSFRLCTRQVTIHGIDFGNLNVLVERMEGCHCQGLVRASRFPNQAFVESIGFRTRFAPTSRHRRVAYHFSFVVLYRHLPCFSRNRCCRRQPICSRMMELRQYPHMSPAHGTNTASGNALQLAVEDFIRHYRAHRGAITDGHQLLLSAESVARMLGEQPPELVLDGIFVTGIHDLYREIIMGDSFFDNSPVSLGFPARRTK